MKKILLTILVAASLNVVAQTIPSYVPTNGLVAWYPFNGNANDESGNGNNGTNNGATLTTDRFGNANKAYSFNGTSNFINVNDNNSLDFTNTLSFSIWVKIPDYSYPTIGDANRTALGKQRGNNGGGFNFIPVSNYANAKYSFGLQNASTQGVATSKDSIPLYSWTHIVGIYDGATVKIYKNGILKNTANSTLSLLNSTEPLFIGKELNTAGRFFKGEIDDVALWNRPLTQQEITNLYTASVPQPVCLPAYVPTNGLVGYWPFCGNANDESGNGNNGTNNGATLTNDRFGNANKAYSFNGFNSQIDLGINTAINSVLNNFTISYWIYKTKNTDGNVIASYSNQNGSSWRFISEVRSDSIHSGFLIYSNSPWQSNNTQNVSISLNNWLNITITRNGSSLSTYINSSLSLSSNVSTLPINNPTSPAATTKIGVNFPSAPNYHFFEGKIDDIAIYNRALTQQEITYLYNGGCSLSFTTQPTATMLTSGSNAKFTAKANDTSATYQWQSNPNNFGWQNIPNNASYAGATNDTLLVNKVQLANHLQPFRVIASVGTCKDTSNIASIHITDTCIVTVNDTNYISVKDTLVINAKLTGVNPPNNTNTIKVYPNPASDHLIINNGNYALMSGYTCEIVNALSQQVFFSLINQQQFNIDISKWTGNGLYFLRIKDTANKVIETKKIVIK